MRLTHSPHTSSSQRVRYLSNKIMVQAQDSIHCIINVVFNSFSSYTSIMLNVLAIIGMGKSSALPKILKTLLISLAVSDLCVGLCAQPIYVARLVICHYEGRALEKVNVLEIVDPFLPRAFWFASFLSVTALGAERFLAIHLHLRYQELVTHKRVVALVVVVWVVSASLSLIKSLWLQIGDSILVVIFGFCFICTSIFYCKIYSTAQRHTNRIQALHVHNSEMAVYIARIKKSGLCTCYVYVVFLLCYLPHYCTYGVGLVIREPNTTYSNFLQYTLTLVYVNSSLNPVVYCLLMRDIRQSILSILRNVYARQNGTDRAVTEMTVNHETAFWNNWTGPFFY